MDEDTRKLILRIQSEDLADLWTKSTDNNSEIDNTLRVYRRQLKLLDRHLENAQQERAREATEEGAGHDAATNALQILDTDTPILTEDGDVQLIEVDYSRLESPILQLGGVNLHPKPSILKTPVVSTIPIYNGTSARPHQVSDRPVVRLPPPKSMTAEKPDQFAWAKHEAAIRDQAEESREEAVRKEEMRKKTNGSRPLSQKLTQRQLSSPLARPVVEMSMDDIFDGQDQKKVERMMTVVPGRAINVLYKALQICHGSFDDAMDLIFHQEADDLGMDSVDLTDSDVESSTAHPNVQSRSASIQSVQGSTRAIADGYSAKPKPSMITLSAAVDRESILASTELSATKTTSLKRSADHFASPGGPSMKKRTSVNVKKESDGEPVQPTLKGTIRDQVEDLLQSARLQSSPTPRAGNLGSRYDERGMSGAPPPPPPGHHQKLDTDFKGLRSGPKPNHRGAPSAPPPPPLHPSGPPSGPRGFSGRRWR